MITSIKQKLATKLAMIIFMIITSVAILSVIYMEHRNKQQLYTHLENTIFTITRFAELGYSVPLWNIDYDLVNQMHEAILSSEIIVACNLYDATSFFCGASKRIENNAIRVIQLTKPYTLPENQTLIKKINGNLLFENKEIGRYEVFYTELTIQKSLIASRLNITVSFLIIGFCIAISLFIGIRKLAIHSILELSQFLKEIASHSDYTVRIETTRIDEIGILYQGVNTMLQQLHQRELERQQMHMELKSSEAQYRTLFSLLQEAIDKEEFQTRISQDTGNSELVFALNKMLSTLDASSTAAKRQNWLKTGQTDLSNIIAGEQDMVNLCRKAMIHIAKYIRAQIGALYVVDDDQPDILHLITGYAFQKRKSHIHTVKIGEGIIGQSAMEKEPIIFTDIPEDHVKIESALISVIPKNIIVVPLVHDGQLIGVVEFGSTHGFTDTEIEFAELVAATLAVAIHSAKFNQKLQQLLTTTQKQAFDLEKQQHALKKANEELEAQTLILKESESKLQVQQEELQATNEELEEKNQMLQAQKREIEEKSDILKRNSLALEQKAKELEIATKYKSEFLANMSHELRTPLNSMLLLSKMLSQNEENTLTAEQIEFAASIHRSGQNLLHLINDILDLAKIEARKIELSIGKQILKEIIKHMDLEFKHMAKEKGIEFKHQIADNLPQFVITDGHRLEQIVRNLLSNAFKFTHKGYVSLEIARPSTSVIFNRTDLNPLKTIVISVSDSGVGIPKDKQQLIFEAFQQVDGSVSRSYGGTGLGLSISRELAQVIGGEIHLESDLGKGSAFSLYIPETLKAQIQDTKISEKPSVEIPKLKGILPYLEKKTELPDTSKASAGETPLKAAADQAPSTYSEKSEKSELRSMLIIEDDEEFANLLSTIASQHGFKPQVVFNGEDGLKQAILTQPCAIMLDIGLPGINGWRVLDELKTNPETRHIPIHIISGNDELHLGLQKGAIGFLKKPVEKSNLSEAFQKINAMISSEIKELLLVEDDHELRDNIKKMIGNTDVHTTAIGSGKEAYELLKEKQFHCMILDLGLPDISGFELLDMIASDRSIALIPIIVYTGRDLTEQETHQLQKYTASIVLKNTTSMDRLLDETTLFLHRVESRLPSNHQQMIRKLHQNDSVLKDKSVLIVDDDMRNAFALSKYLKSQGMNAVIAQNGQKALGILSETPKIDIVLMDIMMPVMDGYETMKEIRKDERFKRLPILALTAKAMDTDRDICIQCGANDYMSKPIDISKLISMLKVWLY
ncbi:MAG: response regulator [Desulfobacterales bacterium]|nr:response regulator [Desulfobacterales bacterium]